MPEIYFITGAQGCIGSWIVKALIERGSQPVVFDRSDDSRRLRAIINDDDLSRVRFITGDITDGSSVLSALSESRTTRDLPSTPFETGMRETMDRFAALRDAGRLDTSDLIL